MARRRRIKFREIQPNCLEIEKEDKFYERGQFGEVKKAKWNNHEVAVKYFTSADRKGGFTDELKYLTILQNHECIVKLHGACTSADQPFIVLEFAPLTLEKVIHDKEARFRYTSDNAINWLYQMAVGLEYIHKKNLLHRDVKPSHVLLFKHGKVLKLCDFGTATTLETTLTNAVGTIRYMAPEVVKSQHYTQSCDVFSFGMVAWEILARRSSVLPNVKKDAPRMSILYAMAGGARPYKLANTPKVVTEMMDCCWHAEPDKRPIMAEVQWKLQYLCKFVDLKRPLISRRQGQPPASAFTKDTGNTSMEMKYEKAYIKAIAEQIPVEIYLARMNFVGLPRSGKTSTLRRLLGEILNIITANFNKEEPSTGVADRKQIFIEGIHKCIGIVSQGDWSTKNIVEETGILNHFIYQCSEASAIVPQPELPSNHESSSSHNTSQAISLGITAESIPPSSESISTSAGLTTSFGSKVYKSGRQINVVEIIPAFQKAMAVKDFERVKYLLEDTVYLITTDMGGQTEFLDLLSHFIMGPALNLIFSRLTDSLDEIFKIYFTNEDGISTEKEDSVITLEEVIFQALASIACLANSDDQSAPDSFSTGHSDLHIPSCTSKAMFIGTFRDQVSQEEFEMRDRLLQEKIEPTDFFIKRIVEYASPKHLILALDNLRGGQYEINRARAILEGSIKRNFDKVRIPSTWLMFSMKIRSGNNRTMTLDECMKIASTLGILPSDVTTVLWFLHYRIGILLYYREVKGFDQVIICDIQVIFDAATQLIKRTFIFEKVGKSAAEIFKEKAQFTKNDLRMATTDSIDDHISMEMIVALFEYQKILAALPAKEDDKKVYFMPSVLRAASVTELQNVQSCADVAPLIIRYKCGYMPFGVFSALIINLVSSKTINWRFKEDCPRRNKIEFMVGEDYDTVTLISQPTFLKVVLYRELYPRTPTLLVCADIRRTLTSTLEIVNSNFKYAISSFEYGFECPLCWEARFHICVLRDETSNKMFCLKDRKRTIIVPITEPRHTIWFQQECPYNDPKDNSSGRSCNIRPEFKLKSLQFLTWRDDNGQRNQLNIVQALAKNWKSLGDYLDINSDVLDCFETKYRGDPFVCCREVMKTWIKQRESVSCTPTWKELYDLLMDLGRVTVANDLMKAIPGLDVQHH